MGRLATHLAVAVANADNLPPTRQPEQVSFWDALLPKSCAKPEKKAALQGKERAAVPAAVTTPGGWKMLFPKIKITLEQPAGSPADQTSQQAGQRTNGVFAGPQRCEIRKDHRGRKVIVAHHGPCYGNGPNANAGDGKGGTEDVKKGASDKEKGKAKEEEKQGGEKEGGDDKDSDEFTSAEDEKLKTMKGEGKTWKEITEELGKPKNVCQARWKEIDPAKAGGDAAGKNNGGGKKGGNEKKDDKPAAEDKKAEEPKKMTKAEKKAAKNAAKAQDETKADDEKKPKTNGDNTDKKDKAKTKPASKSGSTKEEWITLQEDDMFSFGELQLLSELIARYDTERWGLVASRFFDKTGRRVHPLDVRDKFMGSGAMG